MNLKKNSTWHSPTGRFLFNNIEMKFDTISPLDKAYKMFAIYNIRAEIIDSIGIPGKAESLWESLKERLIKDEHIMYDLPFKYITNEFDILIESQIIKKDGKTISLTEAGIKCLQESTYHQLASSTYLSYISTKATQESLKVSQNSYKIAQIALLLSCISVLISILTILAAIF